MSQWSVVLIRDRVTRQSNYCQFYAVLALKLTNWNDKNRHGLTKIVFEKKIMNVLEQLPIESILTKYQLSLDQIFPTPAKL